MSKKVADNMQTFDSKVRLDNKRLKEMQELKAKIGKGKQQMINEAWDDYYRRNK